MDTQNNDNFEFTNMPFMIVKKHINITDDSFLSQCESNPTLYIQQVFYMPEVTEADRILRKALDEYLHKQLHK